jgi:hypothetical protein
VGTELVPSSSKAPRTSYPHLTALNACDAPARLPFHSFAFSLTPIHHILLFVNHPILDDFTFVASRCNLFNYLLDRALVCRPTNQNCDRRSIDPNCIAPCQGAIVDTMTDYNTLKVPELKKLLQEKSLPVAGNKADLIARLLEHDKAQEPAQPG